MLKFEKYKHAVACWRYWNYIAAEQLYSKKSFASKGSCERLYHIEIFLCYFSDFKPTKLGALLASRTV